MNGTSPGAGGAITLIISLLLAVMPAAPAGAQEGSGAAPATPAPAVDGEAAPGEGETAVDPGRPDAELLTGSAIAVQAFHRLLPNDYIRIVISAGEVLSYDRTVDAAGNITLPLVGKVRVEGLTVSGIETLLQESYQLYYISPNVDVALVAVGRAPVLLVYPTGSTSVRNFVNGQTLADIVPLGGGLQFRYAYLVRGGYGLFNRLTRQGAAGFVVAPPLAETTGGTPAPPEAAPAELALLEPLPLAPTPPGLLQLDTGMGAREELRLEALAARPDVQVFEVNLAELSRGGRLEQNIELRAGDIIFLTYAPRTAASVIGAGPKLVEISGVDYPGTYGLLPRENLADLLRLAGFNESPRLDLRNVLIERRDAAGELKRIVLNLDPAGSDLDLGTVELAHRDSVRISPYLNQVFVVGSVRTAGAYAYNPAYKALDYITLAGGAADDAHLKFVKVIRQGRTIGAEVERPLAFNIDLSRDMKGEAQDGYSILQGDIVYVPPKGYEPSIRDVTSALSTVFLGVSFFDDLLGNTADPLPGTGSSTGGN